MPATLDNLQDWLVAIAQHTRETKELMAQNGHRDRGREQRDQENRTPPWADSLTRKIESLAGLAVGAGLGHARALAARGMSGTLEQAQLSFSLDLLGRQFAAVMMPVTQAMTYAANQIERRMRSMGVGQQDRMMGGIVGAGLGWRFGGAGGALAGGALGMAALSGPPGVGESGTRWTDLAAAAYLGFRAAGPVGVVAAVPAAAVATSGDYGRLRGEGHSKVVSVMGAGIASLTDLGHSIFGGRNSVNPMDAIRREADERAIREGRRPGRGGADAPHRDVTPFQAQMGEAGSTYFRMQEAMIRTTADADFEDAGPLKPLMDILLQMYDVLAAILLKAGGEVPAPRPAAGARD